MSKAKAECASLTVRNTTWKDIDSSKYERKVRKLQVRIAKAHKEKRYNKVKALRYLLATSYEAKALQDKMFQLLGFTEEKAQERFGFLMNAFKYGAPPHGGLAYGLDRWVSLFAGLDSIRDCIAFPKNNSGRDVMLDAPGQLDDSQLEELCLKVDIKE